MYCICNSQIAYFDCIGYLSEIYVALLEEPRYFSFLCPSTISGQNIARDPHKVTRYVNRVFLTKAKEATGAVKYILAP